MISLPTWTYKGMNLLAQRNVPGTSEAKTKWAGKQEGRFCQVFQSPTGAETGMGSNGRQRQPRRSYSQLSGMQGR